MRNCNTNDRQATGGNSLSFGVGGKTVTVEPEEGAGYRDLGRDPEKLAKTAIKRGQHRLEWEVEAPEHNPRPEPYYLSDEQKAIPVGDEMKRIWVYKLEAQPTGRMSSRGREWIKMRAVIRVRDNPLPLMAIGYGLSALAAGGGGWLLFTSAGEAVKATGRAVLPIAVAIITVWQFVLKDLFTE